MEQTANKPQKRKKPESSGTVDTTHLTPAQEAALTALLAGKSDLEAANCAGVSDRTIRNWRNAPDFRTAYLAARRHLVELATARLQRASTEAVEALTRNLACGLPAAEIRAGQIILEMSLRSVEQLELEARITALEADRSEAVEATDAD